MEVSSAGAWTGDSFKTKLLRLLYRHDVYKGLEAE
jgi:hypothetical protein